MSENIIPPTATASTPSVPIPEPLVPNLASESVRNFPPPKKKFPLLLLFFLIPILVIAAVISIYILIQAHNMYTQSITSPTPTASAIALASADPTSNWQTYTNSKYNFTFKYPSNLLLRSFAGSQISIEEANSFVLEGPYANVKTQAGEPEYSIVVEVIKSKTIEKQTDREIVLFKDAGIYFVAFKMSDSRIPSQKLNNPEILDQILSTFKLTN